MKFFLHFACLSVLLLASCSDEEAEYLDLTFSIKVVDSQNSLLAQLDDPDIGLNRDELFVWHEIEEEGDLVEIPFPSRVGSQTGVHESSSGVLRIYLNYSGPDSQHVTYVDWSPYDRDTIVAEFDKTKSYKTKIWYNGELYWEQHRFDSCPTLILVKNPETLRGE